MSSLITLSLKPIPSRYGVIMHRNIPLMGIAHNELIKKMWLSGRDVALPIELQKSLSTLKEKNIYIDYLYGRPIKTKFTETHIVFSEYDDCRGLGSLEKIMTQLLNEIYKKEQKKTFTWDGFNLYEH